MSKQFSTTINCSSCVRTVTPALNELVGEQQWFVDTTIPEKVLTILNEDVNENELLESITNLGFAINSISLQ